MKTPYTLRVSDSYRHSDEFLARSQPDFHRGLLDAIIDYVKWKSERTQEDLLGSDSDAPTFFLHLLDPWMSKREGRQTWVICSTGQGTLPIVSARAAFRDGCAIMWESVIHTACKTEELAKFFGYHDNGEHRLSELLRCLDEEARDQP